MPALIFLLIFKDYPADSPEDKRIGDTRGYPADSPEDSYGKRGNRSPASQPIG